jgi:TPR repeat protein
MSILKADTKLTVMLAAWGVLALPLVQPATAQTQPAAAPARSADTVKQAAGIVVVSGTRAAAAQADTVIAAKNKVLSRNYASSCAFMSSPNAAEDDVALAYMQDFGMAGGISDEAEHFSDRAPDGDVAHVKDSSSLAGAIDRGPASPNDPSVKCGASDRRFAAARSEILRKDKSLAQGFEALDTRDYPRALQLLATAYSKIGYGEAGVALAKMHLYGMGTPKDTAQAIRWLRKVTDDRFDPARDGMKFDPGEPQRMSDRVEAAFMLARIYERGIGTPRNPAEAMTWYGKAAEFGFVPARNTLGQAWLAGYGGAQDTRKGIAYLQAAAEEGYVAAQYNLAKHYYTGDAGVPRDLKQAGAWFNAAAKAGYPAALFAAGRMIDLGEGVPADPGRAIVYYKEAAVKGDRDARFALGTFFYDGEVVEKNLATARQLFDAAARQGQVDAMFNLGAMEINGEGGPADLAMAYVWLHLARQGGHASADAALETLAPRLTAQDRARADAILKPATPS